MKKLFNFWLFIVFPLLIISFLFGWFRGNFADTEAKGKFYAATSMKKEVGVPEFGVLDEGGETFHCQFGYKRDYEKGLCIKVILPEHAQYSGSGDDFQCDRDFKRVSNSENPLEQCERIILPGNAHIAAGGNDFDCNTGFKKEGDRCVDAVKPVNAKFFPNSDDWYCESGYQLTVDSGQCTAVKTPANARTSETGTYFYCNQGYSLSSDGKNCERVSYPENAEPNWTLGWDCNQGYKKVGDKCEKVELPENAKWFSRGDDFYCEPGYKLTVDSLQCTAIEIPDNAERDDSSYGGWRCKQGFIKNLGGNRCDQFKLPEHAFWVGINSWDCDLGYKKNLQGLSCDKVSIPEHAHPSNSYDGWDCDGGYVKNYHDNRCEVND